MSVTSRSPTRVAGAVLNSGNVNTGEQNMTFGGAQSVCVYSGGPVPGVVPSGGPTGLSFVNAGPDYLFWSGAGRLKDVFVFGSLAPAFVASGLVVGSGNFSAVTFYDAGSVSSGGPWASGQRVLAVVPGNSGFLIPTILAFDTPFNSGLCASLRSGMPSLSFTFTPEAQPSLANPG